MFAHMGAMSGIGSGTSRGNNKVFVKTFSTLPEGDMSPTREI